VTYTGEELRAIFDAPAPLTVGIEEELMLLDPETLDLTPKANELLERTGGDGRFKLELPAAQFEIASPALRNPQDVEDFLLEARTDLSEKARGLVRLACAGVHPFAEEEGELNAGERYKRTLDEYGRLARRQLVFGLQVHVAVRPAEAALRVYNGLRALLPELLALSANSPFYRGADTGLQAVRPKLCELLPRQGVPPPLHSWDEYAEALRWGERAGGIPEPAVWWWELRPHPSFGTLEVRVPDAQATVEDTAAIVAVVHALARTLADEDGEGRHEQGRRAGEEPPVRVQIEDHVLAVVQQFPWIRHAFLTVGLALEDGVVGRHAVEEQQPVEVVELVLQGAGLERVGLDHPVAAVDVDATHDDARGPHNVAGEVGDAHAPFPAGVGAVGQQYLRVEQHQLAVTGHRLLVPGDVHHEGALAHTDLRRGQTHACG
jgi:carboxylate-amine ligase